MLLVSWPKACGSKDATVPPPAAKKAAAGDDDFDLFGSEEEDDAEKERLTQERVKVYATFIR